MCRRLVVSWRYHVRVPGWLHSILRWRSRYDIYEDYSTSVSSSEFLPYACLLKSQRAGKSYVGDSVWSSRQRLKLSSHPNVSISCHVCWLVSYIYDWKLLSSVLHLPILKFITWFGFKIQDRNLGLDHPRMELNSRMGSGKLSSTDGSKILTGKVFQKRRAPCCPVVPENFHSCLSTWSEFIFSFAKLRTSVTSESLISMCFPAFASGHAQLQTLVSNSLYKESLKILIPSRWVFKSHDEIWLANIFLTRSIASSCTGLWVKSWPTRKKPGHKE